jgi:aryl-phospho-beta-D-glucosidase BglC (GH1 family)
LRVSTLIEEQIQEFATDWLWLYNNERSNMAAGSITPNWNGGLTPRLSHLGKFVGLAQQETARGLTSDWPADESRLVQLTSSPPAV